MHQIKIYLLCITRRMSRPLMHLCYRHCPLNAPKSSALERVIKLILCTFSAALQVYICVLDAKTIQNQQYMVTNTHWHRSQLGTLDPTTRRGADPSSVHLLLSQISLHKHRISDILSASCYSLIQSEILDTMGTSSFLQGQRN